MRPLIKPIELASSIVKQLSRKVDPSPIVDILWSLKPPVIMTTNYDGLIELSYARQLKQVPDVIIGTELHSKLTTPGQTIILKLHGDLKEPASMVFSKDDYLNLIIRIVTKPNTLWAEFARRPTLAIGYSAQDPDLQLILHWINTELKGFGQPLFLLNPTRSKTELCLLGSYSFVIPFSTSPSTDHRSAITGLVQTLVKDRDRHTIIEQSSTARLALLHQMYINTASIAHDLNNQLATIIGSSNLLSDILSDHNDKAQKINHAICDAACRAVESNNELLFTIRSISERVSPCILSDCINNLHSFLNLHSSYKTVKLNLTVDLDGILPVGKTLYLKLIKIMIDNAFDAITQSKNGEVQLDIKTINRGTRSFLSSTVSDNGAGIDSTISQTLFTLGSSTKGKSRGYGLFILRAVTEEAGGSVSVRSLPKKGTAITIEIPMAVSGSSELNPVITNAHDKLLFPRKISVIYVEDDSIQRELWHEVLTAFNCKVNCFASATDALRSIRRKNKPPDILITDIVMPNMAGSDLAEFVRKKFPQLPILFQSGFVMDDQITSILKTALLTKPFSRKTLFFTMAKLLDIPHNSEC